MDLVDTEEIMNIKVQVCEFELLINTLYVQCALLFT